MSSYLSVSVMDKVNDSQKERIYVILREMQKKKLDFIYWNMIRDTYYRDKPYRLIVYGMSCAVPSRWFPQSKSIESAIQEAERIIDRDLKGECV